MGGMMEHHKCKLFKIKDNELYDDQAECWFEIVTKKFGIKEATGELQSTKLILNDFIAGESEYLMVLDDGRKGKILITNSTSNEPRRATFELADALE